MSSLIGVREGGYAVEKRDLLLVDQIAVPRIDLELPYLPASMVADLEWLTDKGLLLDVDVTSKLRSFDPDSTAVMDLCSLLCNHSLFPELESTLNPLAVRVFRDFTLRALARETEARLNRRVTLLSEDSSADVYEKFNSELKKCTPLLKRAIKTIQTSAAYNTEEVEAVEVLHGILEKAEAALQNTFAEPSGVLEVVIAELPTPDDSVPWPAVLEFRQDDDVHMLLLELRRWTRELIKKETSAIDAREELKYLLNSYQNHMARHRMKMNLVLFKAAISFPFQALEAAAKFRFSDIPKPLFYVLDRKAIDRDERLKAPGREVSYIWCAKEAFEPRR